MRRSLLSLALFLSLAIVAGCKKAPPPPDITPGTPSPAVNNPTPSTPGNGMAVHAPTGVVINPGLGGGGSGGAAQAVRKAAKRAATQNDLDQLRLFIDTASLASGQMPTAQETYDAMRKEAPNIYKLIEDRTIYLTGIRSREGIWAYTAEPQSINGDHLVIQNGTVQRMTGAVLNQTLAQQKGR